MGLKPSQPKAPDPTQTANTQSQYNTQTAQNNINMNSLNNSGVFGSGSVTKDADGNVTGQTSSLNSSLQPGADSTANAYSSLASQLPTTAINWDSTTVPSIVNSNYSAYQAMTQPGRDQAQKQLTTQLSDRGIPIGSEVYNDAQGNLDRANSLADQNASAQFLNAAPSLQSQLISNQTNMQNQPYQTAANSLGLLQGLNGLAPSATLGQSSAASPDYTSAVNNNYNQQMQQYNSQMSGLGSLAGAGLGLLTAPLTGGLTGGLSNSLLGQGASSLFNMA